MNVFDFVQDVLDAAGQFVDLAEIEELDVDELRSTEIRFAHQESYPLTLIPSRNDATHSANWDDNGEPVVWVPLSQPSSWSDVNPYAPKEAFSQW